MLENKRNKVWEKFVMSTVAGKTLGIVGFGDIGQCVARMAKNAFGMKVRQSDVQAHARQCYCKKVMIDMGVFRLLFVDDLP